MSVYIGKHVVRVDKVESTNSYARKLLTLKDEIPNGTIVICNNQFAGKGYGTNSWESEPKKNLTFSLILYPHIIPPEEQFNISRAVSLGIYDYLSGRFSKVKIKWPNDIYVGDRKIAGILIENSISRNTIISSIIGIGLNVNQVVFSGNVPNPTSMKLRAAKDFDTDLVLKTMLTFIENRFLQFETDLSYLLDEQYKKALYRLNEFHYFENEDSKFEAKIIDVESDGSLILKLRDNSLLNYKFKEVSFII